MTILHLFYKKNINNWRYFCTWLCEQFVKREWQEYIVTSQHLFLFSSYISEHVELRNFTKQWNTVLYYIKNYGSFSFFSCIFGCIIPENLVKFGNTQNHYLLVKTLILVKQTILFLTVTISIWKTILRKACTWNIKYIISGRGHLFSRSDPRVLARVWHCASVSDASNVCSDCDSVHVFFVWCVQVWCFDMCGVFVKCSFYLSGCWKICKKVG